MKVKIKALFLSILMTAALVACASASSSLTGDTDISNELSYESSMDLSFADQFSVDYYAGGYALVTIADEDRFLLIPQGATLPSDLGEDITPIYQPLSNIYLVASNVMDMFISMDALDTVRFSGTDADGWYLDEAREAMENGDILYAGKYSTPDYETILAEGCDLAVENTMIYHNPEVKEQLEGFDIPVMVDHSSYEEEPLGRTEWVRLYGLLTGHEAEAEEAFNSQREAYQDIENAASTGKTVAFFYITSNGEVNIRRPSDYLPKMIEMAGGSYIPSGLEGDDSSASSTMSLQMEEFYAAARDVDYIIYNSTIEGEIASVDELLGKSELLGEFKAVQNGNVYCTEKNLYQSSMEIGDLIADFHNMLTGDDEALTYLYKVK